MPGVCGVLRSSSSLRTTRTPCKRQSGVDPVVILPQLSSAIAVTSIYACNSHSCQETKKLEPDQEAGSSTLCTFSVSRKEAGITVLQGGLLFFKSRGRMQKA